MEPFVAVYLIVCLNAANRGTCTQLPVVDNTEVQAQESPPVNMAGCLGLEGMNTAIKYWDEHPDLHKAYQYGGWACRIGNKKAPDNKGA